MMQTDDVQLCAMQGPFYVILEAASSDAAANARRLEAFLHTIRSGGGVLGGRGEEAERAAAAAHIWKVRKNLSEGLRLTGGEHSRTRTLTYDAPLLASRAPAPRITRIGGGGFSSYSGPWDTLFARLRPSRSDG